MYTIWDVFWACVVTAVVINGMWLVQSIPKWRRTRALKRSFLAAMKEPAYIVPLEPYREPRCRHCPPDISQEEREWIAADSLAERTADAADRGLDCPHQGEDQ